MPKSFQEKVLSAALELYHDFEKLWNADRCRLQDQFDHKHQEITELIREADAKTAAMQERAVRAEAEAQKLREENAELRHRINALTDSLAAQNAEHSKLAHQTAELLARFDCILTQAPELKNKLAS